MGVIKKRLLFLPLLLSLLLVPTSASADEDADKATFELHQKLAQQGNAGALVNLGLMYKTGRGVAQDYVQAVKWWRKAADQGDALAQSNLGRIYGDGQGVPQDYVQAVKWLRKAAKQGHADAQFGLLLNRDLVKVNAMYRKGLGVPKTKPDGEVVAQDRDAGPTRIR